MQSFAVPILPSAAHVRPRTALVASADSSFRQRLNEILTGLRWQVREASSGAEVWTEAEAAAPEAVIVDSWLPDLDRIEFLKDFRDFFPEVDLVTAGGSSSLESPRGPHRQELLYALRRSQDTDSASWNTAPSLNEEGNGSAIPRKEKGPILISPLAAQAQRKAPSALDCARGSDSSERLPELVGNAPCMLEVSRRIRLVAQRSTPVLIEGPTGSGKELVAEALHRLSTRCRKPLVAINCAAIPEALLEAELFGHTRGAFTGAVQGRIGRIESADGGTLFLDEIGEMPLALQSKLLRFVESGELQRVGDNETVKVNVRHRGRDPPAAWPSRPSRGISGQICTTVSPCSLFAHHRSPSTHRDLTLLVEHFLEKMGRDAPVKRIDAAALAKLAAHSWPGNVRELEHVLERAAILAGDAPLLTSQEIDFGLAIH